MTGLVSVPFLCANLLRTFSLFNCPFIKNVMRYFILSAMYRRSVTKKVWSQVLSFSLGTSLPRRALMPALMTLIRSLKTRTTPLAMKRLVLYVYLLVNCNLTNCFIKVVLIVFFSVLHVVLCSTTLYVVWLCDLLFYSSYLLVFFKKLFVFTFSCTFSFHAITLFIFCACLYSFKIYPTLTHSPSHIPFITAKSVSFFPLLPRLIELLL